MITKNISKHPKAIVEVEVKVPWSDLQDKYSEVLQKFAADVEIPGFRKGQAPLDMAEGKVAAQVQQEVLKQAMPQFLIEALQGTNIVPIDYPKYDVISFQKGQELNFRATVTERPTVKVGDYKKIAVIRPALKPVTDEEVNKIIDDLFKRWKARLPAGQVRQPAAATGQSGSLNFGAQTPIQSGQANTSAPVSDQPDDNFAKAMGGQNLADLKIKIKQDLENETKYNNELDYEELILQQVEKMTDVDIPEVLIQDELNRMLLSLQRNVTDRGLLLEEYLKGQGKTVEQIKNEWRKQAEQNVRMELGLAEIARGENVAISDEELQAEVDKIQDKRVKAQFDTQEPRMHLRHALRQTKTLNLLKTLLKG